MIDDDALTIKVTWTPFRNADGLFLREEWAGTPGCTIWGPCPDSINLSDLIAERQAQIKAMVDKQVKNAWVSLADFKPGDYSFSVVGDTAAPNPRPHPDGGPAARAGSHEGAEPPQAGKP